MSTSSSIDTQSDETNATLSERTSTMASPSPPSIKPSGFLSLPAELRNQIYEHVIEDHHSNRDELDPPTPIPLLAVNEQIRQEALAMFWHKTSLAHGEWKLMPNQSSLFNHMPQHIAQIIGNADISFTYHEFFGAMSASFKLTHDQFGKPQLEISAMVCANSDQFTFLSLAMMKYEAWKAIGQIEDWTERNRLMVESGDPAAANPPIVRVAPSRGSSIKTTRLDYYNDPLYLRIIGCIAGEIHLFLLRHEHQIDSIWRQHRVKILIGCALLWLLLDYNVYQFSAILRGLVLVIAPTIIRFLIETRPWTEKEWILRKTHFFWFTLGLYYLHTVILAIVLTGQELGVWEWLFVFICPILGLFG